LSAVLRRAFHGIFLRPHLKAIASDCDGTLWHGAMSEEGPHGVDVAHAPHRLLQQKLARLAESGVLVCLCSRNSSVAAVQEVFTLRGQEMALSYQRHVAAAAVRWAGSKAGMLRGLARELNLDAAHFAFAAGGALALAAAERRRVRGRGRWLQRP